MERSRQVIVLSMKWKLNSTVSECKRVFQTELELYISSEAKQLRPLDDLFVVKS